MSDYRNDSYQEMKALLNERLDSIVGEREDEEQEQQSGLKKWGKRAAVGALAAGGVVGAGYGARKLTKGFSKYGHKMSDNKIVGRSGFVTRGLRKISARFRMAKRRMSGGPIMRGPAPKKS